MKNMIRALIVTGLLSVVPTAWGANLFDLGITDGVTTVQQGYNKVSSAFDALDQAKLQTFHRYWHSDRWIEKSVPKSDTFDYSGIDFLSPFTASHPRVMSERIARCNWEFTPDRLNNKHSLKSVFLHFIEKKTGWRVGEYRNYRIVRRNRDT